LNLNYTIFDFGARAGRINAAKAEAMSANFAFNDTHRKVIYQVEQAYYQLLNASGQEEAARANLSNARAVQQAAEERLNHGLADIIHERCLRARFVIFSSVVKLCLTTRRFLETERLILGHLGKCKTRFSLKK
jgi:outer membrane protein TolC